MIGLLNLLYHTSALRGIVAIGITGLGVNIASQMYDEDNEKQFAGALGLSAFLGYSTWNPWILNGLYTFTSSIADLFYIKPVLNYALANAIQPFFSSTLPSLIQKGFDSVITMAKGRIHTIYNNPQIGAYYILNKVATSYFFTPYNEFRSAINILAKNNKLKESKTISAFENRENYFDGFSISDPMGSLYIITKDLARLLNGLSNGFEPSIRLPFDIDLIPGFSYKKGNTILLKNNISLVTAITLLIVPFRIFGFPLPTPYDTQIGAFAVAYLFKPAMVIGLVLAVSSYAAHTMLNSYLANNDLSGLRTTAREAERDLNLLIKVAPTTPEAQRADEIKITNIIKSVLLDYAIMSDVKLDPKKLDNKKINIESQDLKDAIFIELRDRGLKDNMIERYFTQQFVTDSTIYKEAAAITELVTALKGNTELVQLADVNNWLANPPVVASENTKAFVTSLKERMEEQNLSALPTNQIDIYAGAKGAASKETNEYMSDLKLFKESSIYKDTMAAVDVYRQNQQSAGQGA